MYIVWKGYQRRAEVLAPLFGAELIFLPHRMRRRLFRPIDYGLKFVGTLRRLLRNRPDYVILQSPPHLIAFAALLTRVPYVIDAHNALFQSFWGRLPLVKFVLRKASGIVVHNDAIRSIAKKMHPGLTFHAIRDPLQDIRPSNGVERRRRQILLICSFDHDEPVDTIVAVVEAMPDHEFVLTADVQKLSSRQRRRLESCTNVRLTGFLDLPDYHNLLCSSAAAVVLTTKEATQQSGACEALSSDTPLIVSDDPLSTSLFGSWATLVPNDVDSIVRAIRSLCPTPLHLAGERLKWNANVGKAVSNLRVRLG